MKNYNVLSVLGVVRCKKVIKRASLLALVFIATQSIGFSQESKTNIIAAINSTTNSAKDTNLLMDAAQSGNLAIVETLIKKGANINARGDGGSTPLINASQDGRFKVVEMLIKKGADINLATNSGSTALGLSSFNGYKNIVKVLLENGANVSAKDAHNKTAIFYASVAGNDDIVNMLVAYGADFHEQTKRDIYSIKGVVTNVDVPGNNFTVKIMDGSVLGAGNVVKFSITGNSNLFGCRTGLAREQGLKCILMNDKVNVYYSGKMAINGFNFTTGSASGEFSYNAQVIAIVNE